MQPRDPNLIVTRFAPSPTGMFHVGGIRSALYNYLYARKHGGVYILRCEDTDPVRSKKEYEEYFLNVFSWLGLEYDEYYRQSERTAIYRTYLERLIEEGKAYISKEEPQEEGKRSEVIRFKNPNKKLTFHDEVLGDITFDTTELGDFVIARELDSPIYHFTVVVDDHEMGVTHIIRGQEHVSNTPRQILIQEAIGAKRPVYAHASIIMNEERAKLSKRDPTVRPALEYSAEGYLPDAMLNFMALLGWSPGDDREIFSKQELVQAFSLERMQKPGAVFNPDKLEWINKEHIKQMERGALERSLRSFLTDEITTLPGWSEEKFSRIVPIIMERLNHFGELRTMIEQGELSYYFSRPTFTDPLLIHWKANREDPTLRLRTLQHLSHARNTLLSFQGDWSKDILKEQLWAYADQNGRGDVLWPIRYALSGKERSPDPFQLMEILGKDESLSRLQHAEEILRA